MKIYTINVDFTQPKDIRLVLPTAETIGRGATGGYTFKYPGVVEYTPNS